MIIQCNECGKNVEKSTSKVNEAIKYGRNLYCSKECAQKHRLIKIQCKCAFCEAELIRTPSEIKKSKTGNVFCNKSCAASFNNSHFRTGENNPNWKGGTYKSSNYARLAFRSYEHICTNCGFDQEAALVVHHIDYNRNNDELDNLMILCSNCHYLVHYGNLEITEELKQNRLKIS